MNNDELAKHAIFLANNAPPVSTQLAASWMPNAVNILRQCATAIATPQSAATPEPSDAERLLHQVFLLCEAVEDALAVDPKNEHERGFDKGRRFEAKQIRRAIGDWFQWTFCGQSLMGEPVLAARPSAPRPVVEIAGIDEYGPRLNWFRHWTDFSVGTQFYAAPPSAASDSLDAARYRQLVAMKDKAAPETIAHYVRNPAHLDRVIEVMEHQP